MLPRAAALAPPLAARIAVARCREVGEEAGSRLAGCRLLGGFERERTLVDDRLRDHPAPAPPRRTGSLGGRDSALGLRPGHEALPLRVLRLALLPHRQERRRDEDRRVR